MASLHWCQDRFETDWDAERAVDSEEAIAASGPTCTEILREAALAGTSPRLLAIALLDTCAAKVRSAAAVDAARVCRAFVAGNAPLSAVVEAEQRMSAALNEERATLPHSKVDWASVILVETATQLLQDWPEAPAARAAGLEDACTESMNHDEQVAAADAARAALSEQEVRHAA